MLILLLYANIIIIFIQCNEESDSNAFKSHTHKLREPFGRPCITPISPCIVPVKGSMAATGRQIKTIDGRILMVA